MTYAVTVTVCGLLLTAPLPTVPEITPVLELMLKPLGRPVALYVRVLLGRSVAITVSDTVSLAAFFFISPTM